MAELLGGQVKVGQKATTARGEEALELLPAKA
jgi:hypothetical protein